MASSRGTVTEHTPGAAHLGAAVPGEFLFLVLEGARPQSRGARYRIDGVAAVEIGRGSERSAMVRVDGERRVLELRLPDRKLSSRHLRLERNLTGWDAIDTESKNGTLVAGQLLDRVALADGDAIELGQCVMVYRELSDDGRGDIVDAEHVWVDPGVNTLLPELATEFGRVELAAASTLPVLVQGETGTGKEVLAQAIHRLSRRSGELVAVNCGALVPGLVESALFGHRRGAFTGADQDQRGLVSRAHGGTLFLDEIGDLPLPAQTTLLRVLNDRHVVPVGATTGEAVDFRLVCATHRDLDELVSSGAFRHDLFARISGFRTHLPPLRERREDLGLLVSELLAHDIDEAANTTMSAAVARALFAHHWPHNVRELRACLASAVVMSRGQELQPTHLPADVRAAPSERSPSVARDQQRRRRLVGLLRQHRGNVSAVARSLGTARMQVQRWLKRYQLDPSHYRGSERGE